MWCRRRHQPPDVGVEVNPGMAAFIGIMVMGAVNAALLSRIPNDAPNSEFVLPFLSSICAGAAAGVFAWGVTQ